MANQDFTLFILEVEPFTWNEDDVDRQSAQVPLRC